MRPNGRTLLAAALLTLAFLAHAWLAFAGVAAVAAGWWLYRLKMHPMGPCRSPTCQGGRNVGSDETQWGPCGRCKRTPGGMGEEPRIGAAWLHPELRRKQ